MANMLAPFGLGSNPLLMMGLGMLGQAGPRSSTMAGGPGPGNAAVGAMQGLQMAQQAQWQQAQMEQLMREHEQAALEQEFASMMASGSYSEAGLKAKARQVYPAKAVEQMFRAAPKGTNAEQLFKAMGSEIGTGQSFQDWYRDEYKSGGTTFNMGAGGQQFAPPPAGQYRPDATQPGLQPEPGYVSAQDRQASAKAEKSVKVLGRVRGTVQRYRDLVATYGVEVGGAGAAQLEAAHKAAIIALKDAAELGALTGPDMDLMLSQLPDVTGFQGASANLLGAGQEKALSALDETLRGLDVQLGGGNTAYTGAPVTVRSDADYDQLPSGTVFVGPDGVPRRKP